MNRCTKCNQDFSEDFRFCPIDGTPLFAAVETEAQQPAAAFVPAASAPVVVSSNKNRGKWIWIAVAATVAVIAFLVFSLIRVRAVPDEADTQAPPVVEQRPATARSQARRAAPSPRRARQSENDDEPESRASGGLVDQVRVQQLVATGYRRMQQRDYQGAQDSFEEALDLDPNNAAAEKGLKAAKMADSVEGVAGMFGH